VAAGCTSRHHRPPRQTVSISEEPDFSQLDDSALISLREEMLGELERLPPHSCNHAELAARYDLTTVEMNERARAAWVVGVRRRSTGFRGPSGSWSR
jgi:hypothetical protein